MTFTEYTVIVGTYDGIESLVKVTDRWKYAEEFAHNALHDNPLFDTVVITLEKVEQDESGEPIRIPRETVIQNKCLIGGPIDEELKEQAEDSRVRKELGLKSPEQLGFVAETDILPNGWTRRRWLRPDNKS
jgi:hypothetical protein